MYRSFDPFEEEDEMEEVCNRCYAKDYCYKLSYCVNEEEE
jgi:hypothetical protein